MSKYIYHATRTAAKSTNKNFKHGALLVTNKGSILASAPNHSVSIDSHAERNVLKLCEETSKYKG